MKKSLILIPLSFLFLMNVYAQMPTEGLKAFYPFSNNADDIIGSNNGILLNNVTSGEDRDGNISCAYYFPGDSSYISVPGSEDFDIHPDSSLTISLWYKGGSPSVGDYEVLFAKDGEGLNQLYIDPAYGLVLHDLNTPVQVTSNGGLWANDGGLDFVADTEWHHLVGVFSSGIWNLYYDNVLMASEDISTGVGQWTSDIIIGLGYEGLIDDIAFYDRALSVQEVGQLYNLESSCSLVSVSENLIQKKVSIFPNPTNGSLKIEFQNKVNEIVFYNIIGEIVLLKTLKENTHSLTLDISELIPGQYIVTFLNNGVVAHREVVKKMK